MTRSGSTPASPAWVIFLSSTSSESVKFAAARRRPRDAALVVGRVLLDPHELIEELIDPERETSELGVVELEALVRLPVQDGEEPLFERC